MSLSDAPSRRRRGNAAATIAAIVPVMGFLALVVDIGLLEVTRAELQAAVDAGALAGAAYFDGTDEGVDEAREMTRYVTGLNTARGRSVWLDDADMRFGYYDAAGAFVESDDPRDIDAVHITKDVRDISTSFAAGAFGQAFMKASADAAAQGARTGVSKTACFLPIAIPECFLSGEDVQPFTVRMTSAQLDNAGWADLEGHPSAAVVRDQLLGTCDGGVAAIGDRVYLNNGQITTALSTVDDLLETSTSPWDTEALGAQPAKMSGSSLSRYGNVVEGPIIVFRPAGGTCGSSTQFNQSAPIVGFAWAVVYDVKTNGNPKTIQVYVDPGYEVEGGLGGGGPEYSNFVHHEVALR